MRGFLIAMGSLVELRLKGTWAQELQFRALEHPGRVVGTSLCITTGGNLHKSLRTEPGGWKVSLFEVRNKEFVSYRKVK